MLKALLLTLLFEIAGAYLLKLRGKDLLLVALVNLITNPAVNLAVRILLQHLDPNTVRLIAYAVFEPLVILVETLFYHYYLSNGKGAFRTSLILNLLSVTGGILWNMIF